MFCTVGYVTVTFYCWCLVYGMWQIWIFNHDSCKVLEKKHYEIRNLWNLDIYYDSKLIRFDLVPADVLLLYITGCRQTNTHSCLTVFFYVFQRCPAPPPAAAVMHSLAQEIQGFSKNRLKKQCTHVTTVTGRKLLERRKSDGGEGEEQVEELEEGSGCGFVEDKSLDLQVGVVRPFLLLGNNTLCTTNTDTTITLLLCMVLLTENIQTGTLSCLLLSAAATYCDCR